MEFVFICIAVCYTCKVDIITSRDDCVPSWRVCCVTCTGTMTVNIDSEVRGAVKPIWSSSDLYRSLGPVCARHHQQPEWGCESWTQTDIFDHNGFHKGL